MQPGTSSIFKKYFNRLTKAIHRLRENVPSNLFQKTLSAPCHTELASRGLVPFIFANAPLFAAVICLKRDIFLASFAAKLFYRIFLHQFVASLPHWLATVVLARLPLPTVWLRQYCTRPNAVFGQPRWQTRVLLAMHRLVSL